MDEQERRDTARKVEIGTSIAAGSVGAALGASKLRDAYKEDYPESWARHGVRARKLVGNRAAHWLGHAKPGFKPLAAGTVTAITATAASKYRQKKDHEAARAAARKQLVAKKKDDRALREADAIEVQGRKVKAVIMPSKVVIARKISNGVNRIHEQVDRDLHKAFDHDEQRRKHARAVQYGATAGAGTMGVMALRQRDTAHRHFSSSVEHEGQARAHFRAAAKKDGAVSDHFRGYAENARAYTTARRRKKLNPIGVGRARTSAAFGADLMSHTAAYRHNEQGREHFAEAFHEGRAGQRALKHANRKTLAAAGLAAVALKARAVKRDHQHR